MNDGLLPLNGITVISIEQAVAAPFATRQLADFGARVIKVERPDGGDFARRYDETVHGHSSYFVWLNRSKESLSLDVKMGEGRAILDRLLAGADVFVQNLTPGAAERLGLDTATLALSYPRLVICEISGYGSDGPWVGRKAYDLLIQSEAGALSVTGFLDKAAKVGISIADIAAGMYAYSGILTALYTRATTGRTPTVNVSLFDSLAEWMSQPLYYTAYGGAEPPRVGAEHATIVPYGPFATADGEIVLLAVQNESEWQSLCENVLGDSNLAFDPRFATNSARVGNRDAINTLVSQSFGKLTANQAVEMLDDASIAHAHLRSIAEFLEHPVLTQRNRWREVAIPGGIMRALLPPVAMSGVTPRMEAVPRAGEHSDAILKELGWSAVEIESLRNSGVI